MSLSLAESMIQAASLAIAGKQEEALASGNHSVAEVDKWEQAHFEEDEIRSKVKTAKKEYEDELRRKFFSEVKFVFYAAAALPQNLWEALEELSIRTVPGPLTTVVELAPPV